MRCGPAAKSGEERDGGVVAVLSYKIIATNAEFEKPGLNVRAFYFFDTAETNQGMAGLT
jgi:hypothetical protein